VILKNYFAGTAHRHLTIVTADCSLNEAFLTQQPISVVCYKALILTRPRLIIHKA
jgi:hypothetical protein